MHKLWATLQKDFKILWRDKVGLTLMFVMPIALVLVITSIQDSTFRMVNDNKITVLFCDRDQSEISNRLKKSMEKLGMFDLRTVNDAQEDKPIHQLMKSEDALVSLTIPINYSVSVKNIAKSTAKNALKGMGMEADFAKDSINDVAISVAPILILHYHPIMLLIN